MKQAIAGVAPAELHEVTAMTVWPSICVYGLGRLLGKLYSIKAGSYIFTLGNLIALASIPIAALLYFLRVLPWLGIRYTLTNRRVIVRRGLMGEDANSVDLDRFDAIDIVVRPGQAWYHAGDLVFRLGDTETFRLDAVSRPETFRRICLHSQRSHSGVKKALAREQAA